MEGSSAAHVRIQTYGRPRLSVVHHSNNSALLLVPLLQNAKRLGVLLARVPLYSHRRLLLLLHKVSNAQGIRSQFFALFLNLYKPNMNRTFYFAQGKKSGALLF